MSADLSVTHLIFDASFVVQLVMLLLLIVSMLSWTIIFLKWAVIKKARSEADGFERRFWSGADLGELYKRISNRRGSLTGMESIFEAGFREFRRLAEQPGLTALQIVEGARRAMRVAQMREMDRLEQSLATLATVGSTSPYVGLFGTVWGIMNSFRGLGSVQSATLAVVAPGIAEALVATAMGLFAAIPAVIAYNRYADQVGRLEVRYDTFAEEFATILQRYAHARAKAQA